MLTGNYSWTIPYLPKLINNIVEIGSRDALDAIELSTHFNCQVIAFEPNPIQFDICQKNVKSSGANVVLEPNALTESDGVVTFWQIDTSKYENSGASSLFKINFDNRPKGDVDSHRDSVQKPISVQGSRWDSLGLASPELCVIDVEGGELQALKGFGARLLDVHYFVLEVAPISLHIGGSNFNEVHKYLSKNNFKFVASDISGPSLWKLRLRFLKDRIRSRLAYPFGPSRFQGFCNVMYKRKF